ncbi:hypothetical protein HMPREF3191_00557 [Veillonellaceae bacterium DNF00626]|nr:hypothetical protein HMPREF3191_00557 [Veillonellaceae bacterium DNF00626]
MKSWENNPIFHAFAECYFFSSFLIYFYVSKNTARKVVQVRDLIKYQIFE